MTENSDRQQQNGVIEGFPDVILVYANTYKFRRPDDPAFPFRMEYNLRPPEFMEVAFITMFGGSEEGTFLGKSVEALVAYAEAGKIPTHPRLRWLRIADEKHKIVKSVEDDRKGWRDHP